MAAKFSAVKSAWRWLKSCRFEVVVIGLFLLVVSVALAMAVVVIKQRNVIAKSLAEQKAVVSQPAVPEPKVAEEIQRPKAAVAVPAAPAAPKQPEQSQVVFTIRQVGGGEEIIRGWKDKTAPSVKIPIDPVDPGLTWENVHKQYLVAVSADKGTVSFDGVDYLFDKGYVGVFITDKPESIVVATTFNESAQNPSDRHFNVWSEVFVVNASMDLDQTAERLLAEWVVEQGKDIGFVVTADGSVNKMKYADAVEFVASNEPLFPDQLPEVGESRKSIIMTTTQVGSGGVIIKDWKNPNAPSVKLPIEDDTVWDGILMNGTKPIYLVLVSSDPGTVKFGGNTKEFKEGFVAAFVTDEPLSISLSTGWNDESGHYNVWAEKFIVPSDEDIDDILKQMLEEWKKAQGKNVSFAVLSDGTVFEAK